MWLLVYSSAAATTYPICVMCYLPDLVIVVAPAATGIDLCMDAAAYNLNFDYLEMGWTRFDFASNKVCKTNWTSELGARVR